MKEWAKPEQQKQTNPQSKLGPAPSSFVMRAATGSSGVGVWGVQGCALVLCHAIYAATGDALRMTWNSEGRACGIWLHASGASLLRGGQKPCTVAEDPMQPAARANPRSHHRPLQSRLLLIHPRLNSSIHLCLSPFYCSFIHPYIHPYRHACVHAPLVPGAWLDAGRGGLVLQTGEVGACCSLESWLD